jgi:hypothetical protein
VNVVDPLWPEASVAVTELRNVPAALGMPEIRPLDEPIVSPGGSRAR